jgi:regulatory protein
MLMRRAHSIHELKRALIRRTADEDLIKKVVDRLKREGLVDDARYAKQFVRQRSEIRGQGKHRIARDLRVRGVPQRHIEAALEEARDEIAERTAIRHRIERKLRLLRGSNTGEMIDGKKIGSLYRSLLRAGFPAEAIRRELQLLANEESTEIESAADEQW